MNYQIIEKILKNTDPSDWLSFNNYREFTYKHDVNLRLNKGDDISVDAIMEKKIPTDYHHFITVYYGNSKIEVRSMLYLDKYKATLPIPDPTTMKVSQIDYQLALVVSGDHRDAVDEYLKNSYITVENSI